MTQSIEVGQFQTLCRGQINRVTHLKYARIESIFSNLSQDVISFSSKFRDEIPFTFACQQSNVFNHGPGHFLAISFLTVLKIIGRETQENFPPNHRGLPCDHVV